MKAIAVRIGLPTNQAICKTRPEASMVMHWPGDQTQASMVTRAPQVRLVTSSCNGAEVGLLQGIRQASTRHFAGHRNSLGLDCGNRAARYLPPRRTHPKKEGNGAAHAAGVRDDLPSAYEKPNKLISLMMVGAVRCLVIRSAGLQVPFALCNFKSPRRTRSWTHR